MSSSSCARVVAVALLVTLLTTGSAAAQTRIGKLQAPSLPDPGPLPSLADALSPKAPEFPAPDGETTLDLVFRLSPLVGSLVVEEKREQLIESASRDNDRRVNDTQVLHWTPEKTQEGLERKATAILESPLTYRPGLAYPAGTKPPPQPDLGKGLAAGAPAKPLAAGHERPLPHLPAARVPSPGHRAPFHLDARPWRDPIQEPSPEAQRSASRPLSAQSLASVAASAAPSAGSAPAAILAATASTVVAVGMLLYALLNRRDLLKSGLRRRIFEKVRREPGITMAQVARAVGVRHQTAAYHLHLLAKAGYLARSKSGGRSHYHASAQGVPPEARRLAPLAHDAAAMRALAIIEQNPGVPKTDVGLRMGFTRTTGVWHVRKLVESGLVRSEKTKGVCRMYVVPERRALLDALRSADPLA